MRQRRWHQTLVASLWRLAARPLALPLTLVAAVVASGLTGRTPAWTPPVLIDAEQARAFLSLLLQTQAAALALTVAAALFAFEALVRQRRSVGLRDYAVRSGLQQFLMLGAAGLLSVGVALAWTPGRPPLGAATVALVIATAWFVTLPMFLGRALTVVGPDWFREQRLRDVKAAVHRHVEREALGLLGRSVLQEQFQGLSMQPLSSPTSTTLETAGTGGELYDVHLGRLASVVARSRGDVVVLAHLCEQLNEGHAIVAAEDDAAVAGPKPVATLVKAAGDEVTAEVAALHEEALEAIRTGSPSAAEEIAGAHVQLLLAWPETWHTLGRSLRQESLHPLGLFGRGPTDEVQSNLVAQLEQAVGNGLRDHVLTITATPRRAAEQALDLQATELFEKCLRTLQGFVQPGTHDTWRLRTVAADMAWLHQAELVDFVVGRRLHDNGGETDLETAVYWAGLVRRGFENLAETLKRLHDSGFIDQFWELDDRFCEILIRWFRSGAPPRRPTSAAIAADGQERDARPSTVGELKHDLVVERSALRLMVLAWILRRADRGDDSSWSHAVAYARLLGEADELLTAAGRALEADSPLSRWLLFAEPGEGGRDRWLDTPGPLLRALGLTLVLRDNPHAGLKPQRWLTSERVDIIVSAASEFASTPEVLAVLGVEGADAADLAEKIRERLEDAERRQRDHERQAVIDAPIDDAKAAIFQEAAVTAWRAHRRLPRLVELGQGVVHREPGDSFGEHEGRELRWLVPKTLFTGRMRDEEISRVGQNQGERAALAEEHHFVQELASHAQAVPVQGAPPERVSQLLHQLRAQEYEPTLLLVSASWRLGKELGLSWQEPSDGAVPDMAEFEGVPVFRTRGGVLEDRVVAVDLAAFGTVAQPDPEEAALEVSITAVDEPEARERAQAEEEAGQERVRELMTYATVVLRLLLRVEVRSGAAAAIAEVPDDA